MCPDFCATEYYYALSAALGLRASRLYQAERATVRNLGGRVQLSRSAPSMSNPQACVEPILKPERGPKTKYVLHSYMQSTSN